MNLISYPACKIQIAGLVFNTTQIAFEVDTVAGIPATDGSGSTVPEPATWALMITGFGLVGVASRRRARTGAVTA